MGFNQFIVYFSRDRENTSNHRESTVSSIRELVTWPAIISLANLRKYFLRFSFKNDCNNHTPEHLNCVNRIHIHLSTDRSFKFLKYWWRLVKPLKKYFHDYKLSLRPNSINWIQKWKQWGRENGNDMETHVDVLKVWNPVWVWLKLHVPDSQ